MAIHPCSPVILGAAALLRYALERGDNTLLCVCVRACVMYACSKTTSGVLSDFSSSSLTPFS